MPVPIAALSVQIAIGVHEVSELNQHDQRVPVSLETFPLAGSKDSIWKSIAAAS